MSIAIVALILLVPIFVIGIVLFAVITGSAASRGQDENEPSDQDSGPDRE